MIKKGNTSVEEEICPVISSIACGGILTLNNFHDESSNNKNVGKVVYGMCKFHASGREDLDVRMLFKPPTMQIFDCRPFVCKIIDVYRVPSKEDLEKIVHTINHTSSNSTPASSDDGVEQEKCFFGNNPKDARISSDLSMSSAHCFSSLQSETESEVKYYGCHCWSQNIIPSQEYLEQKLMQIFSYPLEIHQCAPLRVLH